MSVTGSCGHVLAGCLRAMMSLSVVLRSVGCVDLTTVAESEVVPTADRSLPQLAESQFDQLFPPPPLFLVPPPPPFALTDGTNSYVWRLVPIADSGTTEWRGIAGCSMAVPAANGSDIKPDTEQKAKPEHKRRPGKKSETTRDDGPSNLTKNNRNTPEAITQACTDCSRPPTNCSCDCVREDDEATTQIRARKMRCAPGPPGPPGPPGQPGIQGPRGNDGVPGLVIFANAAAMHAVSLEGLIAYRTDAKQLYFRDHRTWRPIPVSRCGDGVVDHGESCDDANDDNHDDCIRCRKSYCGDGMRNLRTEECDGRDFAPGASCSNKQMTGVLTCTPKCRINYDRCRYPRHQIQTISP